MRTQVSLIETQLMELYADPALDHKPALLDRAGGAFYSEAAVDLLAGLLGSGASVPPQVVNVRNSGTLPFLPDDAVIETPADGRRRARPRSPSRRFPPCTPV